MAQNQQQVATGGLPERTNRGIVKLVLSGDSLVIRGQPRNGPPPEKTVALSNIMSPKLARRGKDSQDSKDEHCAWEAREHLRKLVTGKEVQFSVEYTPTKSTGRVYGSVWITVDGMVQNLTDVMLSEGLAEVRQTGKQNEELERLTLLEAAAKSAKKGLWDKEGKKNVRDVVWSMQNDELRNFVERNHKTEFDAIIEHVRDGATVRVILLPSFTVITLAMAGIKCPMFKRDGEKEIPEPFAEQARYFTECRLLQRDVIVTLEGVSNQLVYGSVKHPAGNISELLLKEGFARCVDWSMAFVLKGKDVLRAAEKQAKKNQLRIWKGFTPSVVPEISTKIKNFTGKVMEVGNGDNLVVKTSDGVYQKIFFSSFRAPKAVKDDDSGPPSSSKPRPLYDIPYMFEAREFMRKKLIGKKVNVVVDYIKPAQEGFPEKMCCTVTRDNV